MDDHEWFPASEAPEGVVVETKIDDSDGIRNVSTLYRRGRLWWVPDGEMYVYYTPTHYRPIRGAALPPAGGR